MKSVISNPKITCVDLVESMPHDVLEPSEISLWKQKTQHHVIRNSALNTEQ